MLNVHVRIVDSIEKKPVAARLRISDDTGRDYPPLGRVPVFACGIGEDVGAGIRLKGQNFYAFSGKGEIPLPAGIPLRIQAVHGPEWFPYDETVTLRPGQLALRIELKRAFDWRSRGWNSFDSRAHHMSPHAALLEADAEDLDAIQLLARSHSFLAHDGNVYPAFTNASAYSGQVPAVEANGRSVIVNSFHSHPVLGHLSLLHTHRPIYPLAFGGADGPDDWSLCDWADQAHRKRGLVVWCDAFREGIPGGEALIALILGKIDAVEYDAAPRSQPFLPWVYKLWNAGFPVPLVGGSAKVSNRTALGAMRTYANDAWIEAIRTGQTFLTNGPLIELRREGSKAIAKVESVVPFEKLQLIFNGEVMASTASNSLEVETPSDGWLAARAIGGAGSPLAPDQAVFAHTSPMVCGTIQPNPNALNSLRDLIERIATWIEAEAQFSQEKYRLQHRERVAKALDVLK